MPERRRFPVDFDEGAVRDFESVRSKDERKAVFNVVDKLAQLGPRLVPPHIKSLAGEADLFELRPRQGRSKARPLAVRRGDGYLVVAVAADHAKDMDRALDDAGRRLKDRRLRAD
jgi:hypothetical protein